MDDDSPPGVPEWVVTYGDMMSLLLTFFIMLVSLSEVVADKRYRAILESIQTYVGYDTAPVAPPGKNFPLNGLVEQLETKLGSFTDKDNGYGGVKAQSVQGPDVRVLRTREGITKRVGKPILFTSGSTSLLPAARELLADIVRDVAGKPNKIEIRAHAAPDPLPADSSFADKIELTYRRARAIAEYLEARGIEHDRIRLTAASDVDPPERTDGEGLEHLDYAEILVSDAFVGEYIGPRDIPE